MDSGMPGGLSSSTGPRGGRGGGRSTGRAGVEGHIEPDDGLLDKNQLNEH